ncbi:MAG: DUF3568 family protein [Candidatus Omnitrophota bacterium]|nr:MAG: DUF3568 family protein [Candidatus Omnitrophota bacterium]
MFKKIGLFVLLVAMLVNISGCVALLAGAAGGGGTGYWLSGKLTQEADASLEEGFRAAKMALKSFRFRVTKEVKKATVAQFVSKYSDGKTIWIDIHKVSDSRVRFGVRVGAVSDKEAARKILDKILKYL